MNSKLKKFFSLMIVFSLCFSLVACKKKGDTSENADKNKVVQGSTTEKADEKEKKNEEEKQDNKETEVKKESETKDNKEYTLYFSDSNAEYLVGEKRTIENANAKIVLEELLKGPKTETLQASLNKDIHIKDVTVKDKIATVDFDESVLGKIAGSTGEQMAMYGIANTLILNEDLGIEKVSFTLNGKPMDSLGGHVILEGPIKENKEIIKK